MTAAWGGVCCSRPPCITVSLRKATYSYSSILEKKAFTISIPSENQAREADYAGIYSGRDENKFEALHFTATKSQVVDAPYVEETPLVLECKLVHHHELGLHTQFVGEVLDVKADENVLGDKGLPMMDKVKPLLYSVGEQSYFGVGNFIGKAFSLGKRPE